MAKSRGLVVFLFLGIISSFGTGGFVERVEAALSSNYYNVTCPTAAEVVRSTMVSHFQTDPTIAAHILRLQFHDCAATGCDASVLLTGPDSEQAAEPNLTLLGFEILDEIKAQLELLCPATVSCADILTMAARDSVFLTGGPNYTVPLGRFDSTFNAGINVNLPGADDPVQKTVDFFANIGLTAADVAALTGAHTIGVSHCSSFSSRMYNFDGTGMADPSYNQTFLAELKQTCPPGNLPANVNTTVALDPETANLFDNNYYQELQQHEGVLFLDQAIIASNLTSSYVNQMTHNQTLFFENFVASILRLGVVGVRDATNGIIRTNCAVVTDSSATSPAASPTTGILPTPAPSPGSNSSPAPVAGG